MYTYLKPHVAAEDGIIPTYLGRKVNNEYLLEKGKKKEVCRGQVTIKAEHHTQIMQTWTHETITCHTFIF
jgi:hypothetical protein